MLVALTETLLIPLYMIYGFTHAILCCLFYPVQHFVIVLLFKLVILPFIEVNIVLVGMFYIKHWPWSFIAAIDAGAELGQEVSVDVQTVKSTMSVSLIPHHVWTNKHCDVKVKLVFLIAHWIYIPEDWVVTNFYQTFRSITVRGHQKWDSHEPRQLGYLKCHVGLNVVNNWVVLWTNIIWCYKICMMYVALFFCVLDKNRTICCGKSQSIFWHIYHNCICWNISNWMADENKFSVYTGDELRKSTSSCRVSTYK